MPTPLRNYPARHKAAWAFALAVLWMVWGGASMSQASSAELCSQDMQGLAASMTQAYERVNDYTTVFYRRGRQQEEELCPQETILLKFRKPFSVYMKWIADPKKGRELIYVKGWNQDLLKISTNTFPDMTLNLDPRGSLVKYDSFGHTLLEVGIGFMVETFAKNLRQGAQRPQDGCKVIDMGFSQVHGEKARCLEGVYPPGASSKYYAPKAVLCLSLATGLPVQARIYDQFGELLEEFGFARTSINVGLTDRDFDPKNPDYDF